MAQQQNSAARLGIATIVVFTLWFALDARPWQSTNPAPSATPTGTLKESLTASPSSSPSQSPQAKVALKVPFTPQAPTGNWDELHNEACEEASAIMVASYFAGETWTTIPSATVEERLSVLTKWQQTNFGRYLDSTMAETAQMIRAVYGLKTQLIPNFTESDIKTALSQGKLVIISVDGRLIGNPNYKAPGPKYHMMVIRGYTSTHLITNDPGTRKGENYTYTFNTLNNATVDWDHSINGPDSSKSVIMVVSK